MQVPFIDLQAMHQPLHESFMTAIENVVRRGNFVLGEEVETFEKAFADYSETKYGIGVSSGLAALKLALLAYDIADGDEVIIPSNTFIATAAAVTFVNATPVLVEPDPKTYNIDPQKIEAAITERTKAIMPVHLYGLPAPMDEIRRIAEKHNLIVIEDASQAHGARYKGQRVGSFGHAAGFSLYPAKNLGAFGDAGIITTDNKNILDKLRAMRNCGQVAKYEHMYEPFNHRLDTMHAAVLTIKLRELDEWNRKRRQVAGWYNEHLQDTSLVLPFVPKDMEPVWHLYVVRSPHRDALREYLNQKGIATGIHYPIPIHRTDYYAGQIQRDYPIAEWLSSEILSLPMYPHMSEEQVQYVAQSIRQFEGEHVRSKQHASG